MKQIFYLSGEHIEIAREEVLALTNPKEFHQYERILILDSNSINLSDRLAYTHTIYDYLFEINIKDLDKTVEKYNWQKIYKKDFCVRIVNVTNLPNKISEKSLAIKIWKTLKKPKVNLTNSKTEITFFFIGNLVFCARLSSRIVKDFQERRPHLRPILHPTSMHPKLARACINLTGILDKNSKIADLLCGSGGILIEMGLMGFKPIGIDNDQNMIWRSKVNLDYFRIKDYDLKCSDATKYSKKIEFVVSDFPYGKNTKKQQKKDLERFYLAFLLNLRKILTKKAVVIFPSFSSYKSILKKSNFKLEKEFVVYIHASLSRKICVIS